MVCPDCLTVREQRRIRVEQARVIRRLKHGELLGAGGHGPASNAQVARTLPGNGGRRPSKPRRLVSEDAGQSWTGLDLDLRDVVALAA